MMSNNLVQAQLLTLMYSIADMAASSTGPVDRLLLILPLIYSGMLIFDYGTS
jgi:hypothetical protein